MIAYVCALGMPAIVLEIAAYADPSYSGVVMAEKSNWCEECGRLKGIGCACGLSFKEKMESVAFSYEGLPNSSPIDAGDDYRSKFPNSKLSKDRPPAL